MRKTALLTAPFRSLFMFTLKCRRLLPTRKCTAFGNSNNGNLPTIEQIYIINLKRQPLRLVEVNNELSKVVDCSGKLLSTYANRHPATDAKYFSKDPVKDFDIDPEYTLNDQLFVEPQPLALPTRLELDNVIKMSRPEIAVAKSHIDIWKKVADGCYSHVLILEDDIWLRTRFAKDLNEAWAEITDKAHEGNNFDLLYLSYEEVKHGAPKTFLSKMLFQPERGLWNLSGYVISKKGAERLLELLPCKGPVDLWMNHQFKKLNVCAIRKSIIDQRPDFNSTNSYSILPSLTKIGVITSEAASLYHIKPTEYPVFVFGPKNSGLTSIAVALSMLGYRCCSDLDTLPQHELEMLLEGKVNRIFNAYVNINSLGIEIPRIKILYPNAKFIFTTIGVETSIDLEVLIGTVGLERDIIIVDKDRPNKWQLICEYLRCSPPAYAFPEFYDIGQRQILSTSNGNRKTLKVTVPKRDQSPWIIEPTNIWQGIESNGVELTSAILVGHEISDSLDQDHWFLRDDTFTDNLALFRPNNFVSLPDAGFVLNLKKEMLGVREYSAAAITSRCRYVYGRFEATFKASNVPGVINGFFLYRDSPRQEIDIEIAGNKPTRLMVNVFYNPGAEGTKFDYGYRGSPTYIELGFDASKDYHRYAIEWAPHEICWYVDDYLVHRRVDWNPTPIPQLPMAAHLNVWPCRSKELAGSLKQSRLPAQTFVRSISIKANMQTNS
ncbi:family 16 glycosylhydrolase [Pedobacter antarcticus]|uniref:family 16 glycosylhydrolase n=1 Tax=Pedobacter antarcticus TaxID=34086 RepID=UPI000891CA7C|nr:family 16 glycosylhydrolase [Pedobacter antarcticus]SDL55674.1 Glycosyltransferase family 25 (LPS biosynthesis protein) [Pedobacter antarcticus]